jgi:hypothetical protein
VPDVLQPTAVTDLDALAKGVDAFPAGQAALQDYLLEQGLWDWPTVNRLVCAHPESDGLRLLAATWLEENAVNVKRCDSGAVHRHPGRVGEVLHGLRHDTDPRKPHHHCDDKCWVPNGNRDRAEFVRCQVELTNHGWDKSRRGSPTWACFCASVAPGHHCSECLAKAKEWIALRQRERELWEGFGSPYERAGAFGLPPNWIATIDGDPLSDYQPSDGLGVVCRGFLAEVRGPLAVLLGGPCGRCEGAGGRYGDLAMDLANGTVCRFCRGPDGKPTGRTPGVLPALVQDRPLERAVATDLEPQDYHNNSTSNSSRLYGWHRVGNPRYHGEMAYDLPDDIWKLVAAQDGCESHGVWADFRTRAAALDALSVALLSWAKSQPVTGSKV